MSIKKEGKPTPSNVSAKPVKHARIQTAEGWKRSQLKKRALKSAAKR